MKLTRLVVITFASIMAVSASSVFAGAKTTVNNDSQGGITATADATGSDNEANSKAASVSVNNKEGQTTVNNTNRGSITSKAYASGSRNEANARATAVDVNNGD
jgi:hypothetical protein